MAGRSSSQNATMYDFIEPEYGTCPTSIGELMGISKLDDSCTSNPEIRNLELDFAGLAAQAESNLRFRISGFEILESSNFKTSSSPVIIISAYKNLKETYVE